MARQISSSLTIINKFFVVTIWMIMFCAFTIALVLAEVENWWTLLRGWIFLALVGVPVFLLCIPLKRVAIDGEQLVVSNFIRTIRIDPSNITGVTQKSWYGFYLSYVQIHLKNPTVFGDKISFIPTVCLSAIIEPHPIVSELKKLAGLGESEHDDTNDGSRATLP